MVFVPNPLPDNPDLSTPDAIRDTLRRSYESHYAAAEQFPDLLQEPIHHATLWSVDSSYYEMAGRFTEAEVRKASDLFWIDVLPFMYLPEEEGLTALIEYVLWKDEDTREAVQVEELAEWIREGALLAAEHGRGELLQDAVEVGIPWAGLLGHEPE